MEKVYALTKAVLTSSMGRQQTSGEIDYIKDDMLYIGANLRSVLVSSESDLPNLTDYEPGTLAFTVGYKDMWQLGLDGSWVSLFD